MPDVVKMVEEVAEATASVSKEIAQRDAEKNTADMKAAAVAAEDQTLKEKVEQDLATGNVEELRKDVS